MTVTVTVAGQAAQSQPYQSAQPPAGWKSLQVPVSNVTGDWMIALVTWRQQYASQNVTVHVGDDSLGVNFWQPLGQPSGTSSAAGVVRCAIWTAPAAQAAQYVLVAPTGTVQAIACTVLDVAGLSKWQTLTALQVTEANAATTLTALSLAAPASQALIVTACGNDNQSIVVSAAGSGWSSIATTGSTNGTDHTADIVLNAGYQVTTGSTSITYSCATAQDLCGIIAGVLVTAAAPAQASPDWPVTVAELAIGAGPNTPADQLTWTPVTARALSMTGVTQGSQYNTGALTAGQGTVTFDNPDGALIVPGTGSFAGIDSGTPFRIRQIWPSSATPYGQPFCGAIRKWPQDWDPSLYRGEVQATIADAWAYVTGNPTVIALQELLNDQPYALWPLIDPAGSTQASNYAPGNSNPLILTQSKYGGGGTNQAFGANSTGLLGAQGTYLLTSSVRVQTQSGMYEATGYPPSAGSEGSCLLCQDNLFPSLASGITIETVFQVVSPGATSVSPQPLLLIANIYNDMLFINPDPTTGDLYLEGSTFGPVNVGAAGVSYNPSSPLTHFAITCTNTAWTTYVNGVKTASGTFSLPAHMKYFALSGAFTPSLALPGTDGYFGFAVIYPSQLQPARIMTHYKAIVTAMTGDTMNDRIERLIQAAPYYGRRVILQDSGYYVTPCASCQDISGQAASVSIQNVVLSAPPSVLGVSPAGEVFYLPRGYTYNQPVQWTLGDNTGAGEIPYETDYSTDYDPLRVINDVQFTQLDNQDVVIPQAQVATIDAASQLQYGDQQYWQTGYLENDLLSGYAAGPGLTDAANWLGGVYAKPQNRVAAVTVDCATKPGAWPLFMHAAKGQLVTVSARPVTSGITYSITGRISQTTRDLKWSQEGCTGKIGLVIDIAPELNVLTADDPARGQLTGLNVLAY